MNPLNGGNTSRKITLQNYQETEGKEDKVSKFFSYLTEAIIEGSDKDAYNMLNNLSNIEKSLKERILQKISGDIDYEYILKLSIEHGLVKTTEKIIKMGSSILFEKDQKKALKNAIESEKFQIIELLLKKGYPVQKEEKYFQDKNKKLEITRKRVEILNFLFKNSYLLLTSKNIDYYLDNLEKLLQNGLVITPYILEKVIGFGKKELLIDYIKEKQTIIDIACIKYARENKLHDLVFFILKNYEVTKRSKEELGYNSKNFISLLKNDPNLITKENLKLFLSPIISEDEKKVIFFMFEKNNSLADKDLTHLMINLLYVSENISKNAFSILIYLIEKNLDVIHEISIKKYKDFLQIITNIKKDKKISKKLKTLISNLNFLIFYIGRGDIKAIEKGIKEGKFIITEHIFFHTILILCNEKRPTSLKKEILKIQLMMLDIKRDLLTTKFLNIFLNFNLEKSFPAIMFMLKNKKNIATQESFDICLHGNITKENKDLVILLFKNNPTLLNKYNILKIIKNFPNISEKNSEIIKYALKNKPSLFEKDILMALLKETNPPKEGEIKIKAELVFLMLKEKIELMGYLQPTIVKILFDKLKGYNISKPLKILLEKRLLAEKIIKEKNTKEAKSLIEKGNFPIDTYLFKLAFENKSYEIARLMMEKDQTFINLDIIKLFLHSKPNNKELIKTIDLLLKIKKEIVNRDFLRFFITNKNYQIFLHILKNNEKLLDRLTIMDGFKIMHTLKNFEKPESIKKSYPLLYKFLEKIVNLYKKIKNINEKYDLADKTYLDIKEVREKDVKDISLNSLTKLIDDKETFLFKKDAFRNNSESQYKGINIFLKEFIQKIIVRAPIIGLPQDKKRLELVYNNMELYIKAIIKLLQKEDYIYRKDTLKDLSTFLAECGTSWLQGIKDIYKSINSKYIKTEKIDFRSKILEKRIRTFKLQKFQLKEKKLLRSYKRTNREIDITDAHYHNFKSLVLSSLKLEHLTLINTENDINCKIGPNKRKKFINNIKKIYTVKNLTIYFLNCLKNDDKELNEFIRTYIESNPPKSFDVIAIKESISKKEKGWERCKKMLEFAGEKKDINRDGKFIKESDASYRNRIWKIGLYLDENGEFTTFDIIPEHIFQILEDFGHIVKKGVKKDIPRKDIFKNVPAI